MWNDRMMMSVRVSYHVDPSGPEAAEPGIDASYFEPQRDEDV